jgi:hypothetical protein
MNYIATSEDFYRVAEPESAEMALKAEQSDAEVEKVRSQPGVSP